MKPIQIIETKSEYIYVYPSYAIQSPNQNAENLFSNPQKLYTVSGLTFAQAALELPNYQQDFETEIKFIGAASIQQPDAIPFFYYSQAALHAIGDFSGTINFRIDGAPQQAILFNDKWLPIGIGAFSVINLPQNLYITADLASTATTPVRTVNPAGVGWAYVGRIQFYVKQRKM